MAFQQVGLRVDAALLERLDKYVEATGIARSTVVRIATQKYLDAWEAQGGGNPPETLLPAAQTVSASTSASSIDEQARQGLLKLAERTRAMDEAINELQENMVVMQKSIQQNFGLIEGKADGEQFARVQATVEALQAMSAAVQASDAQRQKAVDKFKAKAKAAQNSPKPAHVDEISAELNNKINSDDFASQL